MPVRKKTKQSFSKIIITNPERTHKIWITSLSVTLFCSEAVPRGRPRSRTYKACNSPSSVCHDCRRKKKCKYVTIVARALSAIKSPKFRIAVSRDQLDVRTFLEYLLAEDEWPSIPIAS